VQAKPDEIPTAGQVLRFRDGREGVVSAINSSGATVYVGPQAFMIPRGDWPAAFLDAMLASDYAEADVIVAERVVPLPAPPMFEREVVPAIMRPGPGDERLHLAAEPAELAPTITATTTTDDAPIMVASQPSAPTPARESKPSRRDRKRQP